MHRLSQASRPDERLPRRTMTARRSGGAFDADAVEAGLRAPAILDAFGARYRDAPTIRLTVCPQCGEATKRAAVAINRASCKWVHHGGPCRGAALDLVAAFAGLDRRRDFVRLLEIAAPIAGVTEHTSTAVLDEIKARAAQEQAAYEHRVAAERAAARAAAPGYWARLARRSVEGEAYLVNRGLDPAVLVARDAVRFDRDDPAVALHAYDGAIINVARRRRDPAAIVKAPVLPSCTTDGTFVGRIGDLDATGGPIVAVLVEGVTDSLAAVLAFPGCLVVGAHCADRLPHVAAAIVPRLVEARGWLLVVPDVDASKGEERAADAVRVAERAGLKLDESIQLVDVRPHEDLTDAWRAGWRWSWQ
jgi:hypothetical protein